MFAVVIVVLCMVMALAIDFSRYVLVSEKLQTAADSAALAAARSAKRYVKMKIDPGRYEDTCCDSDGKCHPCCKDCGDPMEVTGLESDLVEKQGYKRYCCSCGCGPVKILDRWVEYEANGTQAKVAAETFFNLNKPKEMDAAAGGESEISSISVYNDRGSPLYPSVVVKAQGKLKTLMLNFMDKIYLDSDMSELGASRCAQGGTFYYDLDGKYHRVAREGCN